MDGDSSTAKSTTAPASEGARVPGTNQLTITASMLSHTGCVRSTNEDWVVYSVPEPGSPDAAIGALALVADGMGGHAAGEVASEIAATTLHYHFYRQFQPVPTALAEGLTAANRAIHERAQADPACAGMGTTCTAVVLRDDHIWLGHVGDSRCYLIRNNRIYKISEDHSLVAELIRQGSLTEGEAKTFPDRNIILRALGIHGTVQPTVWDEGLPAKPGDVLVICSDGLSDVVDDDSIRNIVGQLAPFDACEALIRAALDAEAPDNVSVGVISLRDPTNSVRKVGRSTKEIASGDRPESTK